MERLKWQYLFLAHRNKRFLNLLLKNKKFKKMKKLTGILCALSLLISASSFTASKDDTISAKIKSAFEKTFTSAADANWQKVNEFYTVNFKVNGRYLSAAYNQDGELLGATRNITLSELPLNITLALKDKYADYTIDKSVTEMTVNDETSYYIKAENAKKILTLKANSSGYLSLESKTKK
jgi:hypothetical protein